MKNSEFLEYLATLGKLNSNTMKIVKEKSDLIDKQEINLKEHYKCINKDMDINKFYTYMLEVISKNLDKDTFYSYDVLCNIFINIIDYDYLIKRIFSTEFIHAQVLKYAKYKYGSKIRLFNEEFEVIHKIGKNVQLKGNKGTIYDNVSYIYKDIYNKEEEVVFCSDIRAKNRMEKDGNKVKIIFTQDLTIGA